MRKQYTKIECFLRSISLPGPFPCLWKNTDLHIVIFLEWGHCPIIVIEQKTISVKRGNHSWKREQDLVCKLLKHEHVKLRVASAFR